MLLVKNNGEILATEGSSGSRADAFIRQSIENTDVYVVIAASFSPYITEGYTLSLYSQHGFGYVGAGDEWPYAAFGLA